MLPVITAIATIALGLTLLLGGFSTATTVMLGGTGLVLLGALVLLGVVTVPGASGRIGIRIGAGLTVLLGGGAALLGPGIGIRVLVGIVAAGLLLLGADTARRRWRGGTRLRRASDLLLLAACGILGLLAIDSWPVLAVAAGRLVIGAGLAVLGLLALRSKRTSREQPNAARGRLRLTAACTALLCAVGLAVTSTALLGAGPRPAPDAFAAAPQDVPAEPGRLLRVEPFTTAVPAGAEAWRILYTTTTQDGAPALATGLVLAPEDRGAQPLPLLSIAHGTTGVSSRCAPSLSTAPFGDGAQEALFAMVTEHGWAGVLTDYVGLGTAGPHPYLIGPAEGRSVLDASRAARELTHLDLSSTTVLWGHSQGGHAALWAGQIAPEYAPDLQIAGIAALAPATDLEALAEASKNDMGGRTIAPYIASSWDAVHPELGLRDRLTPGTAGDVDRIAQLCFTDHDAIAALLRGSQIPVQVLPDAQLQGPLGDLLRENTPTGPFPAPVLVAQGDADPLVRPRMQEDWVMRRCADGIPIDYRAVPGRGHVERVAADSPINDPLVAWTLDRWDGDAATPTCGAR
ncbi:lipase family protein [Brachybacterium hainanense]|uniref:Lipase family protein n=1 Tax=Brachybacterium hainanense TaxID=1541174 RepID=A0ABV6R9N7_9MICO